MHRKYHGRHLWESVPVAWLMVIMYSVVIAAVLAGTMYVVGI